ncbi:putative golgin subfamily A member 6-like protein 19 [Boleophthalmus pectinirostris]|uniref:putative golgin subfamily A member 6-like protein 19 n=1 Tax=Boleophthalmus pectinirostris TaxID=150288 RepID=UPI00242ECDCC|nr:putative golgin subfamily A member 6-like protein 19 [Boleophthalmus pectinirostris]
MLNCHLEKQTKRIHLQDELLEKVQMRCDEAEGEVCPHLRDLKEERQQHAQLKDSHSELLKTVTELNQEKVNLKEELETLRTGVGSSNFVFKSYKKRMSEDLKCVENRLSEECRETERQRQRNTELSEEMEILCDEHEKIKQEKTRLQEQIQQMCEELQKAHAELESSTKTLAEEQRRNQLLTRLKDKYKLHDDKEEDEDESARGEEEETKEEEEETEEDEEEASGGREKTGTN